jgi:lipoyl(octanoyl) transferase
LNWRFIPFAEFDGALNMAIDVVLLERAGESVPVLRLYGFAPPCVSLGFAQSLSGEIAARATDRGFEIVRRPSGGRAVVHVNDLTYAFAAGQKGESKYGALEASVSAAYKQICQGLQEALRLLGVEAELGKPQTAYRHLVDCFSATTNADLHYQGAKLAGSAQVRRRGAVLQHGSIPLCLEADVICELLGIASPKRQDRKVLHHANLFDILGQQLSFAELNRVMKAGFEKAFSVEFDDSVLHADELAQAADKRIEFLHSSF